MGVGTIDGCAVLDQGDGAPRRDAHHNWLIIYTAVHQRYADDYWHPLEVWKRQRREAKQSGQ
jgi:hypothetical protein